jgi:hypothetical protein
MAHSDSRSIFPPVCDFRLSTDVVGCGVQQQAKLAKLAKLAKQAKLAKLANPM